MRTTKELLELMLLGIVDNGFFRIGLCGLVDRLYYNHIIDNEEYLRLYAFVKSNPPKKTYDDIWYWKPGNLKPRIVWLKKHIEKNSNINL
jgi:hypothetical protein